MGEFHLKPDILQTAKGSVIGDIDQLQTAIYGREVRASIAEALYLLYNGEIVLTAPDGTQKFLAQMLDTSAIEQRLKYLEMAVGIYAYPYPDLNGDGEVNVLEASWMQSFAAAVGNGAYTNDAAGWAVFAEENQLADIYPDVNGDGFVDSVDASLISKFSSAVGNGAYTNDRAGWNAYMNETFKKVGTAERYVGTLTPRLSGITGTAGQMVTTETEE